MSLVLKNILTIIDKVLYKNSKFPGNAGIQLGTNSIDLSTLIKHVPDTEFVPAPMIPVQPMPIVITPSSPQHAASNANVLSTSIPYSNSATVSSVQTTSSIVLSPASIVSYTTPASSLVSTPSTRKVSLSSIHDKENFNSIFDDDRDEFSFNLFNKTKKSRNVFSHNYIHASNPNLVEFDFHTSKTLDHSLPKIGPSNTWDAHNHNLQGVTLKDLMLQKQAEDAQEMYNNRVYLGVEKKDDYHIKKISSSSTLINSTTLNSNFNSTTKEHITSPANSEPQPIVNKIQSRSLPKTPDYAQSFKPDDKDIIMARSKEGQKLRDFGYELISGDDQDNARANHTEVWVKRNDKVSPSNSNLVKKKSLNWINSNDDKSDKTSSAGSSRQGSLKKIKMYVPKPSKLDNFKASGEKLLFKHHSDKLTNNTLTISPSNNKAKHSNSTVGGLFTVYNQNPHDVYDSQQKNITSEKSTGYLSKFSFSSKTPKERRLLGSPRLHRAIFGRSASHNDGNFGANSDREIFSQVNFNKVSKNL